MGTLNELISIGAYNDFIGSNPAFVTAINHGSDL